MVQPVDRRGLPAFILVLAVYLAISLYRLQDVPPLWYDEIVHINSAEHLEKDGVLSCDFYEHKFGKGALFNGMPLNWVILACYGNVFGFGPFTSRLLYLLLSAVILICVYVLSGKMFGDKTAIISSVVLASSFIFFHNSRQIIPQVPAAAFSILAILAYYFSRWRNSAALAAIAGLAGGAAALSHPLGGIVSFAVIALMIRNKTRPKMYLVYLLVLVATLIPYAVYVASNYPEYLNQTKAVVKEMYINQPVYMNLLDELPVRYFGLPRLSNAGHFVREFLWQIKHVDLRIWFCETVRSLMFLFPVFYLLLKRKISGYGKEIAMIAAIYIALTAFHPNKFGPYIYPILPYFAICFVLFVADMVKELKTRAVALAMIILFIVSNPLFISKELLTYKIEPYKPFIERVETYMKKGSTVAAPVYFWPGMHKDYRFVSVNVIVYEIDEMLKDKYGGLFFKKLTNSEKEKIVKEVISRNKIDYVLMTTHSWEGITEAPGLTEALTPAVRRYLFYNSKKVVDFLRSNYYEDLAEAMNFEDEVYGQRVDRPGFRNVNDEYQKSLKIYRLK